MSQLTTARRPWLSLAFPLPGWLTRLVRPDAVRHDAVARAQGELLSLVSSVCAAIVLVKAFIAFRDLNNPDSPPHLHDGRALATLGRVVACCAEDLAVGAGCLFLGALALRRTTGWPWLRGGLRLAAHLAAVVALVLLVVNAQLFHVLRQFLTFSVFRLGGGGLQFDRSVAAYVTLPVKLALALLPTLTIALHLGVLHRFPQFWGRTASRLCRPGGLVLFALLVGGSAPWLQQSLMADTVGDYGHNPHLHFVRSLLRNGTTFLTIDPDEADVEDFLPGRPGHTPNLLAARPKNLIVITLESVRASHFQAYGCPLPTTPRLQALADRSLVFDNFYANANHSIASAHSILCGLYNDPSTLSTVIDYPEFPSPHASRWLQQLGYRTYFLASGGKWGWEDYRNMVPAYCVEGYDVARDPSVPFWRSSPRPGAPLSDDYLDAAMFADARRALRAERGNRFALFLWAYETHAPYYEGDGPAYDESLFPAGVRGNAEKEAEFRAYLRALWRTDRLIGELYDELEALGLAEETVIALTGDHGEAFGEHGWFGHGRLLYEEEVRVPLILIGPRLAPLGRRSSVLGSHVDLWATLTDICGLPADPRWQGRSLVSGGDEGRRAYFYRLDHAIGVREGRYKYIWDFREGRHLLYDIVADPGERRNLAPQMPERCDALHRRVAAWTAYQRRHTQEALESVAAQR